jgi:hypothetical protein
LDEALTMAGLQTEYAFTLPKGYVDGDGTLHRHGTMRLATARDEIEPLRDPRIDGADDPYLTVLVISRVVTELGSLRQVTPHEVENMFAADLAFLQDLYGIINFGDPADVALLQAAVLPAEPVADEPVEEEPEDDHAESVVVGTDTLSTNGAAFDPSPRRRGLIEEVKSSAES